MKLSKSFLNEYIDVTNLDFKEVAEKMVFAGNEYEEVTKISPATGVVVGYILECNRHPESDKLNICKVDLGSETRQILCGGANVAKGQKVIVAKIGAVLPDNFVIGKAKLAGMDSEGMICSLEELGIDKKFISGQPEHGIYVLPEDATVGADAINYLGFDDEVIDFELTPDRADLLSVMGMAYEIGALYDLDVKYPSYQVTETNYDINNDYSLSIETDKVSAYLGKLVKNIVIKDSPNFIKTRLIASGIRPINNVVDISNYVMIETGQPLHFFDADKLGNEIIVRNANENEKIITLDKQERILSSDDLVIANKNGAVALAGVMGGLDTEVTPDTKNIFIESAIFDSFSVRKTSKKILRSEASSRFEKGIDPNRTLLALKRAAYLLSLYAKGEVTKGVLTFDNTLKENKEINISLDKINSVLGMNLTTGDVTAALKKLKFEVINNDNNFKVLVPTRRLDVNIKEDLIEEVGRIIGFDKVEAKMPLVQIKPGKNSPKMKFIDDIKNRMISLGLNETINYSLVSEQEAELFINDELEKVYLALPMSEDKKIMRRSLTGSLVNVYKYNKARNVNNINIFEIANVYYKKEDAYLETTKISILISGNIVLNKWQQVKVSSDFYLMKGLLENLLDYIGLNGRYKLSANDSLKDMHPGRSAEIIIGRDVAGYIGEVHPSVSKDKLYVLELDLELLMNQKVRVTKFKELSKFPGSNKDLAFIVDKNVLSEDIEKVIKKAGGRLLTNVEVFDVYVGENVSSHEKSLAYSLTFEDPTKTLTEQEITEAFNLIISKVEATGAKLRSN